MMKLVHVLIKKLQRKIMPITKQNVEFLLNELEDLTLTKPTTLADLTATGNVSLTGLTQYADNAAAIAGGLVANDLYVLTATKAITIVI